MSTTTKPPRQLSRLSITGHVHEHTPMCVLMEIADAHGIKYDHKDSEKPNFSHHLLASIHQTHVPTIGEIKEIAEWQFVARFVNTHSQWPQSKLTAAYNFLIEFMTNEDPLNKIPIGFIPGLQIPNNPLAVNACVLYKTCIHHRLNVNSRTTINQMAHAVKMLRENIESVFRRARVFIDRDAKRADLINALMLSPHEVQDPEPIIMDTVVDPMIIPKVDISHDHLAILHQSLTDIRTLQQKIDPTTDNGSVALAAINFSIDISKSSTPTREYKALRITGRNDYKPVDPWMQHWYKRNRAIFDLSVTFNPLFPVGFYDTNRLVAMVQNEGCTAEEMTNDTPYELLQLAYVAETFYQGEMPNMKSTQTPITLDDIQDVPYGELLCFGQMDAPLQPVSMRELTSLFNANQNFTNPFRRDSVFGTAAINKLKLIAQSHTGPIPTIRLSAETIQARANLVDAILGVELIFRSNDEPTRQFAFAYRNCNPETKQAIRAALTNLLHVGMYMRGWNGNGEYPVIRAPVPPEREPEVAVNVTTAMSAYEAICRSLGKLGTQINNLPLVTQRDGQYQVSTSITDGLTIGERINIVKQGDQISNMASCIRLSSNWICASAHKYMMAIGLSAPFDIFTLRHIS